MLIDDALQARVTSGRRLIQGRPQHGDGSTVASHRCEVGNGVHSKRQAAQHTNLEAYLWYDSATPSTRSAIVDSMD